MPYGFPPGPISWRNPVRLISCRMRRERLIRVIQQASNTR
ncbi:hypothetical protein HMPREF9346_03921 [Escherichia coli MS 119-7]|nr:hypothetical protein HMPREF9346_03921 [Escherichia coli MS 119-7]